MKQSNAIIYYDSYKIHTHQCWMRIIILLLVLVAIMGCSPKVEVDDWQPNTHLLDAVARQNQEGLKLANDVKLFYELLRDKKWHDTYERRAKAFREDMLESEYIKNANEYGKAWGLVNYDVLSVTLQDSDVAILICKFTELPDCVDSYSTVYWHKEGGVWKCLSAGPKKMGVFNGTRPVTINW